MSKKQTREGFSTVTPYLLVRDAKVLLPFIKQAFGAVETYRSSDENGNVHHAELRIRDSMIMLGTAPTPEMVMPCNLHLYVDNSDRFYLQALQAGGTSLMEPNNRPYGERLAGIKDPTGNVWWIASLI